MSEITLYINFRQALIFKHSLENMINSKEEKLNLLIAKDRKTSDETKEAYKLKKDIYEERDTLCIVNVGLDKFHEERRTDIRNYAENLPKLLKDAERNNKA